MGNTLKNIAVATTTAATLAVGGAAIVPEQGPPQHVLDQIEAKKQETSVYSAERAAHFDDLVRGSSIDTEIKKLEGKEKAELKSYQIEKETRKKKYYFAAGSNQIDDYTIFDKVKKRFTANAQEATTTPEFEIEIVETNVIDGGIEIYARAWLVTDWIKTREVSIKDYATTTIEIPAIYATTTIIQTATTTLTIEQPFSPTTTVDVSEHVGYHNEEETYTIPAGTQISFGSDGTVEIERFRIFNPPVLIPDQSGDIIRTNIDPLTNENFIYKLSENPEKALWQALGHIVLVTGKDGTNIEIGKIGNTTDTFYSGAGDGGILGYQTEASATQALWDELHDSTTLTGGVTGLVSHTVTNGDTYANRTVYKAAANGVQIGRTFFPFDTSSLPDSDTISSATFSVYGAYGANPVTLGVVQTNQSSMTSLALTDFDQCGDAIDNPTEGGSRVAINSASNQFWNWTLDSTGITWIDKTGWTKLGLRTSNDIDDTLPTSGDDNRFNMYYSDYTGSTQDPKLVVEHAAITNSYDLYSASRQVVNDGCASAYATCNAAAVGNAVYDISTVGTHNVLHNSKISTQFYIRRADYVFDTSAIPDDATIIDVSITLFSSASGNADTDACTVNAYDNTNNTNLTQPLATEDYNDFNTDLVGTKDLTDYYNIGANVTMNLTDTTVVSVSGYTRIGLRLSCDVNVTEPTGSNILRIANASDLPYITVTYLESTGAARRIIRTVVTQ